MVSVGKAVTERIGHAQYFSKQLRWSITSELPEKYIISTVLGFHGAVTSWETWSGFSAANSPQYWQYSSDTVRYVISRV
jgi:hypothetical protein